MRAPERRRPRPSDGLVVEASIVARLLGIRLLTLHATVVVSPAEVTAPAAGPHDARRLRSMPTAARATPAGASGRGLAEAVRTIDESAAIIAASRRDGSR
ncbi:MAG TPA: hypothetical protein VF250_13860 [Conexibacter sp.]